MIGSRESCLQIAQEGIDRTKLRQLYTGSAADGDGALVSGSRFGDGSETHNPSETTLADAHSNFFAHWVIAPLVNSSLVRQTITVQLNITI